MQERVYLRGGGPMDGQVVTGVPATANMIQAPGMAGRYMRTATFEYDGPPAPAPDRWARKVRKNPFPKPRG